MKNSILVKQWTDLPLIITEVDGVKTSTALLASGPKKSPVFARLDITERDISFIGELTTHENQKTAKTTYAWPTENDATETVTRLIRRKPGTVRAFLSVEDFQEAGGGIAARGFDAP